MKVMNVIEFHVRIMNIIKNNRIASEIDKNNENHRIPYENYENHEYHRIGLENI